MRASDEAVDADEARPCAASGHGARLVARAEHETPARPLRVPRGGDADSALVFAKAKALYSVSNVGTRGSHSCTQVRPARVECAPVGTVKIGRDLHVHGPWYDQERSFGAKDSSGESLSQMILSRGAGCS
jgi:hypothetical protein